MSKDAYYFSHDANAQDDEKILDLRADYGWKGYGLFWAVLELMRNQSDYMLKNGDRLYKKLAMKFNVQSDYMKQFMDDCCNYGLFKKNDDKIYSKSFLERMEIYEAKKAAAKKAAAARWNKDNNANAMQTQCDRIANAMRTQCDGNAIKLNEIKRKEILKEIKEKEILNKKEYTYAENIIEIFSCWKTLLSDINDARLTKNCIKIILTKLKKWDKNKIIQAIKNYNNVYRADYYYSHNWTLQKFIKQGNAISRFLPGLDQENDGDLWKDYKKRKKDNKRKVADF